MNPFSNNRPRLTASEGIRNKRDKTIYQAEKQRFQNHKTCGNKNVRYYDNGTIRSIQGYKLQQSLARGNVLCEDCNDRGMLCGKILNKDALGTIRMGNSALSEYWGGGILVATKNGDEINVSYNNGWPVVTTDVSGTWDPSGTNWKGDISPGCTDCSYGYVDNQIAIPRNLDGSGIVIDPSNILFPDELCDPFRYLQKSYLKTYLVIRGAIDLFNQTNTGAPGSQEDFVVLLDTLPLGPQSCDFSLEPFGGPPGPIYRHGVGTEVYLSEDISKNVIVNGRVKSLCCIKEIKMNWGGHPMVNNVTPPPLTQQLNTVGIFDMYVELSYLSDMSFLSKLINYKPQYYQDKLFPGSTGNNSGWDWMPLCSAAVPSACNTHHAPFFLAILNFLNAEPAPGFPGYTLESHTTYNYIESFNLIQGTIPTSFNQTKYNATKQSYMSCLEDGTRKINFTKNTVKQNNLITAYCQPGPLGRTTGVDA